MAVTVCYDVVGEYLDMASLSSTTTGPDICEHVIRVVEKFELNPAKLCGLATDGATSMIGRINGFTKAFMDTVGSRDVVVNHCIIQQENLCTNVLAFSEVIKSVVQHLDYIRARGLNRRQFKAFLEYLHCDYPDVVYFSSVHWLCRPVNFMWSWNQRQVI